MRGGEVNHSSLTGLSWEIHLWIAAPSLKCMIQGLVAGFWCGIILQVLGMFTNLPICFFIFVQDLFAKKLLTAVNAWLVLRRRRIHAMLIS